MPHQKKWRLFNPELKNGKTTSPIAKLMRKRRAKIARASRRRNRR